MVSCIVDRRVEGLLLYDLWLHAVLPGLINCQKPAVRFTVAVAIATVNLKVADIIYQ